MTRILLIDDEPDILRVLSRSLATDGYTVACARSGTEGLAAFEAQRADIVVTDIKMPGMDGIEVLKHIKARDPDSEVVIITGHGDIDSAVEALQFGASDFINKPVRDEALSIALKRAEDKIDIKRQLKEHTHDLEHKIETATRELRRRRNFLGRVIRSSNDGIVATDEHLGIVVFNPGAESIFGYPQEEVVHKRRLPELLPENMAASFLQAMTATDGRKDWPWTETELVSRTGERIPVRFSASILNERGQKLGAVAFIQDLREIKGLQLELVRSERLAAIGQTVAGLAHGIKNVLQGLKGGSYLVDVGITKSDSQKLQKGWDMIKRSIDRTSNLVMDLLSYSKEREPEYKECAPNEIAAEVCDLVRERAQQDRTEIVRDFDPAIGRVCMDPHTIHTALLNFVSNALDACLFDESAGKSWQVRVRTGAEPGQSIRFDVSDNGAGMSDEVQGKLFSSFFSTKGHRGTGLGLLVTRKLVEEHGGSIEVTSRRGEGTTFSMHLPVRTQARPNGPPRAGQTATAREFAAKEV
jgi:PAS domain S-box-containing protein